MFNSGIKAIDINYLEKYSKLTELVLNEYRKCS